MNRIVPLGTRTEVMGEPSTAWKGCESGSTVSTVALRIVACAVSRRISQRRIYTYSRPMNGTGGYLIEHRGISRLFAHLDRRFTYRRNVSLQIASK